MSRYGPELAALREAVLASPGETGTEARRAAYDGGDLVDAMAAYVHKVRDSSHRITDSDVAALKAAGYSEDAIFEMTLAAAVGAASCRLQAGMRALVEGG
jgi:alkylhydroperoxidase family enzyme